MPPYSPISPSASASKSSSPYAAPDLVAAVSPASAPRSGPWLHPLWRSLRKRLWLLPLIAALVFVAGVLGWAYRAERDEAQERRATMIADALSSEAQLRSRLDFEIAHLEDLARQLQHSPRNSAALAAQPEIIEGLRRFWLSVTWLDANKRIVAHVPEPLTPSRTRPDETLQQERMERVGDTGLSSHLTLRLGQDTLVVRYSAAALLRRGIPWWVTRKYEVQLIDASEQIIASVDTLPLRASKPGSESYKVIVGGNMPGAYLELTLRELPRPFWRTLPLVLIVGFLLLMLVATLLLRQQMLLISRAKSAWRTEAAWRQAMEDSALVGLRARDMQGRILYVNRTFCDMVGLPSEQLIGLLPPMPYWPPDAIDEVMQRHQRNLAGKAPREGYEALWRHQDGSHLNVMVFESPLVGAHGAQIGWMGSIIDITAHKQLEARERQQAEAHARQSRLTTLGEIASALAHQLNQPLTAIIGYNAGLQRMLSNRAQHSPLSANEDTMRNALKHQGEQAALAGSIVGRIRDFLTRRAPEREACDLVHIAQRVAQLLAHDLAQQRIHLQWALAPDTAPVYADPILLEQVLINLLRNAIDALKTTAHASGRDTPQGTIRISAQRSGERLLRMDIDDSGPGLNGHRIEHLSEPFYSTKSDGMGMGLSICRSIIEVHHGSLHAGPSPLGGARFSFTLPLLDSSITESIAH